jgi:hypothetical protein
LVYGSDAGHGPTVGPLDYRQSKLVYPTLKDAGILDAEVSANGLGSNEDVVRGDNGHGRCRAKLGSHASPEDWLS